MNSIIKTLYNLSISNRKSVEHIGLKLSEEVGECNQALLSYVNASGSEYKGLDGGNVKEECVDVTMVAMSLFFKLGGTQEELWDTMKNKCNKWEVVR